MDVHLNEIAEVEVDVEADADEDADVDAAVAAGRGRSEALECCSEQTTPGGATTPISPWLHLVDKTEEKAVLIYFIRLDFLHRLHA